MIHFQQTIEYIIVALKFDNIGKFTRIRLMKL